MILSGNEIRQQLGTNIIIDPFNESRLNPNSSNLSPTNIYSLYGVNGDM